MPCEHTHTLAFERVPDIAVVVVVPGKQEATREGEGDRGDTTGDILVAIGDELTVGPEVEELAGRVVGTRREGVTVGEESAESRSVSKGSCPECTTD